MRFRLGSRLVYWAARAAIGVAARVPEWLGYGAARLLGRLYFRCDGRRRRYALTFLRQAYPERSDRELLAIAAAATAHLFCVPLDMARLTRWLQQGRDLRQLVDHSAVPQVLAMRPPFLALTAHLGGWEVAAVAMAQHFGSAHGVARVSKNPWLQRWILGNRRRGGLVIHPRRGGIRGLARAVEQGGVGMMVVDQNQRLRPVFAPFFGRMAACERAAVTLALRRGYPLVVGAALRVGRGFRFRLVASESFTLRRTGDAPRDLEVAVGEVNRRIEALIRLAPEQYLWIHDRYRTQPRPDAAAPAGEGS